MPQSGLESAGASGYNIASIAVRGQQLGVFLRTEAGATRILGVNDNGAYIRCADTCTVTVPPNSAVSFPLGTQVMLEQAGAGQVTIAAGVGVTINTSETLKTAKQHAVATLVKIATNEWSLLGYLEAA